MVSHHLEIERKYELADPLAEPPTIDWHFKELVAAQPVKEHLDATYYETDKGDLGRNQIALRRRLGGYDEGWHIKFGVAGNRHEVGFPLEGEALPRKVAAFVHAATLGAELKPRVSLVTDRVRTVLSLPQLGEVAEICEDSVESTDYHSGRQRRWREWEVELLAPAAADRKLGKKIFKELDRQLKQAGALPSQSPAKIARALGQDRDFEERSRGKVEEGQTQAASPHQTQELLPDSSRLLTRVLEEGLGQLVQADLLMKAGVPDASHRGRKAARRLRGTLKFMVRPYTKTEDAKEEITALGQQLRTYAAELEENRNCELIESMLTAELPLPEAAQPGVARLLERVLQQQTTGHRRARDYLDSRPYLSLLEALRLLVDDVTIVTDLPLNSENYLNKVAKRLRKSLLKTLERSRATWPQAMEDFSSVTDFDEGLHDIRKGAKAVGYVLRAGEEAGLPLTADQRQLMTLAKELQAGFGELTDELTYSEWVQGSALEPQDAPDLRQALAAGFLLGASAQRAQFLREQIYRELPATTASLAALKLA